MNNAVSISKFLIIVLLLFGLVTIIAGGSVIFDLFGVRKLEGHYILFIVWTNFICGFLYVLAAYGWLKQRRWAVSALLIAAMLLFLAFGTLLIYISGGRPYEMRTLGAMVFRMTVTLAILLFMQKNLNDARPAR